MSAASPSIAPTTDSATGAAAPTDPIVDGTDAGGAGDGAGGAGDGAGAGGAGAPPATPDERCTNRVNYAGDPRPNAEINSIGERTGTCPAPITPAPATPDERCTNRVNYAGDPRSNAEINSIGERTGTCPAPITPPTP